MAAVNGVTSPLRFLPLPSRPRIPPKPRLWSFSSNPNPFPSLPSSSLGSHVPPLTRSERERRDRAVAASAAVAEEDLDAIPVQSPDSTDQQDGAVALAGGREQEEEDGGGSSSHSQVGGFAFESGGVGGVTSGGGGGGGLSSSPSPSSLEDGEDVHRLVDRAINAAIVLAAGTYAVTKLLTIDRDYWQVGDLSLPTLPQFSFFL